MQQKSTISQRHLLTAKVQPAGLRVAIAREKTLIELFENARRYPVTFVGAPAGYGKTVLLQQWAATVKQRGDVSLWLFLDEEDTADTICDYLIFACGKADESLLADVNFSEQALDQSQSFSRFSNLLACLEQSGKDIYVFLDDAERLSDASAIRLINFFVDRIPGNVTVAIAGRQNPGIDLASHELTGNAFLLKQQHLQFTASDYSQFFNLEVPSNLIKVIEEKTEGWGAALQMIKIAISKGGYTSLKDIIADFTGKDGLPADYIGSQIYAHIPSELQQYLKKLSAIEWFDQDIASQMTSSDQDIDVLVQNEQLSGFLIAANSSRRSYRLHSLLREYCLQKLKQDSLCSFRLQHSLATNIMAQRGHLVKALKHALESNDKDLFVEIFERFGGLKIWLKEGMRRLTEAVSLFEPGMSLEYPRLGLAECIVLIKQSRLTEAKMLLDKLGLDEVGVNNANSTTPDEVSLDHDFVQTMMTVYGCKDLSAKFVTSILPDTHKNEEEEIVLGHNKTLLCVANAQEAKFSRARKMGYEAIDHFKKAATQYGILFIDYHLGAIEMACGHSVIAAKHYDKARRLAKKDFHQDPGPKLVGDILTFELAIERSKRAGLNSRLNNILNRLHSDEAWLDIYIAAYVAVGNYLKQINSLDKLESFLDEGLEYAAQTGINRLRDAIWLVKTDSYLMQGRIDEATKAFQLGAQRKLDYDNLSFENDSWRELELHAGVSICLDIACNRLELAASNARSFMKFAHKAGMNRSQIKAACLLTVANVRLGRWELAFECLDAIYPLLEKSGYYGAFVRFKDDFLKMRTQSNSSQIVQKYSALFSELDDIEGAGEGISFTDHEKVVIEHLRGGLQDKQIARKIGLTEHAVRYHLKKIYQKVHAGNRTEAIINIDKLAS